MESKRDSPVKKVSEAVNRQMSREWLERWRRPRAEKADKYCMWTTFNVKNTITSVCMMHLDAQCVYVVLTKTSDGSVTWLLSVRIKGCYTVIWPENVVGMGSAWMDGFTNFITGHRSTFPVSYRMVYLNHDHNLSLTLKSTWNWRRRAICLHIFTYFKNGQEGRDYLK